MGIAADASVSSSTTTTNTTFTALGGPVVTSSISASGKALVMISALSESGSADVNCLMSFLSTGTGGEATAGDDTSIRLSERSNPIRAGATYLVTGLTAGNHTFSARYRASGTTTCTWTDRNIIVIPLPN
jgi:hypothetical protein